MPENAWSVIAVIISALITASGVWWNNRINAARLSSQNDKDQAEALQAAFRLAGMDLNEQLALRNEVGNLRDIVMNSQYRITQVMLVSMNEKPRVESLTIEQVRVPKQEIPVAQS